MILCIITGYRRWQSKKIVFDSLNDLRDKHDKVFVCHGDATGADSLAHMWARQNHMPVFALPVHPDEWKTEGRRAGMRRNADLLTASLGLAQGLDLETICYAYPDEKSKGTFGMMNLVAQAGIQVVNFGAPLKGN